TLHLQTLATRDITRISLSQEEIPIRWYNIQADLTEPLPPPLDPGTRQPVNPASLERIFAKELIRQEISSEQTITIPETVLDAYIRIGRPTPWYARGDLRNFSKPLPRSSTKPNILALQEATSPTLPWLKPITTVSKGLRD